MRTCLLWWIVAGTTPKRGNKMNLLRKLSWFFNLEKKRYLIGIGSLILVSFLNLIPPRIMGLVIDLIDKRRLTLGQLVVDIAFLVLAALAMYGLRFVWRRYIFGTANKWLGSCVTVCLSNLRSCLRLFISVIGQGISWPMLLMISMR